MQSTIDVTIVWCNRSITRGTWLQHVTGFHFQSRQAKAIPLYWAYYTKQASKEPPPSFFNLCVRVCIFVCCNSVAAQISGHVHTSGTRVRHHVATRVNITYHVTDRREISPLLLTTIKARPDLFLRGLPCWSTGAYLGIINPVV